MDKPVLILDNNFDDLVSSVAQPYYASLKQWGIVWNEPVRAAKTIENILPNVNEWWHEPSRRAAVIAFREKFGRTADLEELGALCKGNTAAKMWD